MGQVQPGQTQFLLLVHLALRPLSARPPPEIPSCSGHAPRPPPSWSAPQAAHPRPAAQPPAWPRPCVFRGAFRGSQKHSPRTFPSPRCPTSLLAERCAGSGGALPTLGLGPLPRTTPPSVFLPSPGKMPRPTHLLAPGTWHSPPHLHPEPGLPLPVPRPLHSRHSPGHSPSPDCRNPKDPLGPGREGPHIQNPLPLGQCPRPEATPPHRGQLRGWRPTQEVGRGSGTSDLRGPKAGGMASGVGGSQTCKID